MPREQTVLLRNRRRRLESQEVQDQRECGDGTDGVECERVHVFAGAYAEAGVINSMWCARP
jgi:hypothetical protein